MVHSNCTFTGTQVEVDAVVYATGYEFGFPYLEEGVIEVCSWKDFMKFSFY